MAIRIVEKDDYAILNYCAKYLARDNADPRHNFFGRWSDSDVRARVAESWRFPLIDGYSDGADFEAGYAFNEVTFVYQDAAAADAAVVGTFANLYEPLPLRRVADTPFFTLSIVVPKGEVHYYKFLVGGRALLDPINPQQKAMDNGVAWSRFFTQLASEPVSLERWEIAILGRLSAHILPFQTEEGRNFLSRFYDGLDAAARSTQYARAYRLDQPVGVVNFIDKLLAREENHRLADYRVCLRLIDRVLRQRNPYVEPALMPKEIYVELYEQMAAGAVPGWSYAEYSNPRFFLQLLRRHVFTGAFSHPKYGGNAGGAAWAYLEEKYRDREGHTLFDWRRIIEKPLGESTEYHG
jgi:gluconate 2-dehydrogenase subunit 3-like protein